MANIIIVEDDLTLANIYKKSLEEGGHTAEVVSDVEAVNTIKAKKPQLVLLDILRELKADPVTMDVPVLMLTNVAENDSIAKGLEYGALGYLLKSETTPNLILSRVERTLEETSPPVS